MKRTKEIFKTGIIGIITNIILVIFKVIVGIISGSVAIITDGINNLTDAASSIVTIIGAKLAAKPADKKHPFGHGRAEYFSTLVVSIVIILTGATALEEAINKIVHPTEVNYSPATIIVMIGAIITKIILGIYTWRKGDKLNSGSLIGSGKDALMDSLTTGAALISIIIYLITGANIDGPVGILISVMILRTGIGMVVETYHILLGQRVDSVLSEKIITEIADLPHILGVYDLTLSNYGPGVYIGFVHVELSDTMTATEINDTVRHAEKMIYQKFGIFLTVGIYIINTKDKEIREIREKIVTALIRHSEILQIHGFYVDKKSKTISFDAVLDFSVQDRKKYLKDLYSTLSPIFPKYTFEIQLDTDYSLTK
jgi:cation diffusion facilitator family transporter